jgi:hypothetical protein
MLNESWFLDYGHFQKRLNQVTDMNRVYSTYSLDEHILFNIRGGRLITKIGLELYRNVSNFKRIRFYYLSEICSFLFLLL